MPGTYQGLLYKYAQTFVGGNTAALPLGNVTVVWDTSSPLWTPEGENTKATQERKPTFPKRKPTYDPRQFIPKRKGGLA